MKIFTLAVDKNGEVQFAGNMALSEAYMTILKAMLSVERQSGKEEAKKEFKTKGVEKEIIKKAEEIEKEKLSKPPEEPPKSS